MTSSLKVLILVPELSFDFSAILILVPELTGTERTNTGNESLSSAGYCFEAVTLRNVIRLQGHL